MIEESLTFLRSAVLGTFFWQCNRVDNHFDRQCHQCNYWQSVDKPGRPKAILDFRFVVIDLDLLSLAWICCLTWIEQWSSLFKRENHSNLYDINQKKFINMNLSYFIISFITWVTFHVPRLLLLLLHHRPYYNKVKSHLPCAMSKVLLLGPPSKGISSVCVRLSDPPTSTKPKYSWHPFQRLSDLPTCANWGVNWKTSTVN